MLKIRLARVGKKKQPTYRFVVSDSLKDLYGRQLEILGSYNPFTKVCDVKKDRILYWISKGAQASPTAHNLLVDQNVITAAKVKASSAGKKAEAEKLAAVAAANAPAAEKPAAAKTDASPDALAKADVSAETSAKAEEPAKAE